MKSDDTSSRGHAIARSNLTDGAERRRHAFDLDRFTGNRSHAAPNLEGNRRADRSLNRIQVGQMWGLELELGDERRGHDNSSSNLRS